MAYSGQSAVAYQTGYQDGIFSRPRVNPYKVAVVPKSFRAYEEGFDDGLGSTSPPRGPAGAPGEDSEVPGPVGPVGPVGANGIDGLNFLQGAGPPAAGLGAIGDTYWDNTTSGDIYTKTGATTWTFTGRIGEVTLAVEVDDTGGSPNLIYKGDAAAGSVTSAAVWRAQRITITTDGGGNDDIKIEWADGDVLFNNIWDNHLALSYS